MGNGSKGVRLIEDFCPSSQSGKLTKKIACVKKLTMLRFVGRFPQMPKKLGAF